MENNSFDVKKMLSASADESASLIAVDIVAAEKKRQSKKTKLIKLGTALFFSAMVLIFMTIAWFSMNRETSTSGMGVKTAGMPFELAVTGDNVGPKSYVQSGTGETATYDSGTEINNMAGAVNVEDGTLGTYTYITDINSGTTSSGSFYSTGGSKEAIKWRLSSPEESNGLGPNSSGKLTFYIVPKQTGTLKVKIKLELEGYSASVSRNENNTFRASNLSKISSGDSHYQSVEYLNNHILFFKDWTGDHEGALAPYYYRSLIENGEYEIEIENCVIDRLVPVTIYWIWPNTYAQLTCIAASNNVANSSSGATTEDASTVASLRNYIINNRADILKSDTDLINLMADSDVVEEETVYSFNASSAATNLEDLSMAYNLADQDIGTDIQYFLLTLTAE
ncbi:hypothetical protein [Ruminococcus albus]|uniref:Uncharacterized protein n=1 Tax=Ruminococcus albus TaxID=1264 RepID=A0A1I1ISV1_RUMAL|nr:hypothetical protein [Ruminococcus albus]SFC39314.1 hypothetical protein SAMN02910406_01636 [Ruminococcus albus]